MIHCSKLLHTLAVVLILFETTLNVNYFPHRPLSSPLLYIPSHPLHLPAHMRCFAPFLPILLPPHDARRTAVGALPIVGRLLLQLWAGTVHVEDEVACCAAQHHAWLVTHLAQVIVLAVIILFVEDLPGLLLVDRDLLILLFSAIRIDELVAWWCIDGLFAWTHRSTLINVVILTPFILFVRGGIVALVLTQAVILLLVLLPLVIIILSGEGWRHVLLLVILPLILIILTGKGWRPCLKDSWRQSRLKDSWQNRWKVSWRSRLKDSWRRAETMGGQLAVSAVSGVFGEPEV